jgi:hypothetical protein
MLSKRLTASDVSPNKVKELSMILKRVRDWDDAYANSPHIQISWTLKIIVLRLPAALAIT